MFVSSPSAMNLIVSRGSVMTELTRPIIGIEHRTAQEVFDIMCDRIRAVAQGETLCSCGLPMTVNPHPDAGKPGALLEIGAMLVCIPCMTSSRHQWAARAQKAESRIAEITIERDEALRNFVNATPFSKDEVAKMCSDYTETIAELEAEVDQLKADVNKAIEIVSWYGEEAKALAANLPAGKSEAVLASVHVLANDAGNRAALLARLESPPVPPVYAEPFKHDWVPEEHRDYMRELEASALALPDLRKAVQAVLDAPSLEVHVGYDEGAGGGNFVYADAVRLDDESFVALRRMMG